MSSSLPLIPNAMDLLDRRLRAEDDAEGILQVLRILQRLGLSREDLQVHLERTRAVNDVQGQSQLVEDNCLFGLDVVLGLAGDLSLRWDARETARLLLPRCVTESNLQEAIAPALARSDMLPPRHGPVPVEAIQANLGPQLTRMLKEAAITPQPATFVRVPKDHFVTRPAALLAPSDRVCFEALADMIAPVLDAAAPSNIVWPRSRARGEHSDFASRPVQWDYPYIVAVDIERFFENVDHARLALVLASELRANSVFTRLIEAFLDAVMNSTAGLPQGPQASEIFASCYLLVVDKQLVSSGIDYVRYMDDFLLGARSVLDARMKLEAIEAMLRDLGLSLNSRKTWPYRAEKYRHRVVEAGPARRDNSRRIWFRAMAEDRSREADVVVAIEAADVRSVEIGGEGVWEALYDGDTSIEQIIEDLRQRHDHAEAASLAEVFAHEANRLRQKTFHKQDEDAQTNLRHALIYLAGAEVWVDWADLRHVMLWYPALAPTVAAYLAANAATHEQSVRAALAEWLEGGFDTDWIQCWACSVAEARPGLVVDDIAARLKALCAAGATVPLTAAEATRALAAAHRLNRTEWEAAITAPAIESELYLDAMANPAEYPWLTDSSVMPAISAVTDDDREGV